MKTLFTLFIVLPTVSFSQVDKLWRKADKTDDPKKQIVIYSKIFELDPQEYNALFNRGIARDAIEDFEGAIMDYTKFLEFEEDSDAYFNRGNSRFSMEDYTGALNDYSKALELKPYLQDALYNLANTKYELEDYEGAIDDYNLLIIKEPKESKHYSRRGASYMKMKKYNLAISDFSKSINIDGDAISFYNRGIVYDDMNDYENALQDFSKSIEINKKEKTAYFYRGVSNFFLQKYEASISDFMIYLKDDPYDYESYLGLAFAYHKLHNNSNFAVNFNKAKSLLEEEFYVTEEIALFDETYWFEKKYSEFISNYDAFKLQVKNFGLKY